MRLHRTQQIREAPLRRWCRSYQRCWSASQTRLNCSAGRKECKGAPSTCDFEDRAGGLSAFVVSVGRPGAMLVGTVAPGKKNRHVAVLLVPNVCFWPWGRELARAHQFCFWKSGSNSSSMICSCTRTCTGSRDSTIQSASFRSSTVWEKRVASTLHPAA